MYILTLLVIVIGTMIVAKVLVLDNNSTEEADSLCPLPFFLDLCFHPVTGKGWEVIAGTGTGSSLCALGITLIPNEEDLWEKELTGQLAFGKRDRRIDRNNERRDWSLLKYSDTKSWKRYRTTQYRSLP